MTEPTIRLVAGLMTGTSLDGIDAALVRVVGTEMAMRVELLRFASRPLAPLAESLRRAADQAPMTAGAFARLAGALGTLHAEVLADLLSAEDRPALVAAHGQTVFHAAERSWQLLDPAPIVQRFAVPVVTDLRSADLAAGGRGAPITPIADWIMLRDPQHARVVVNLGGFVNITVLPPGDDPQGIDSIDGGDVCACNHVLDAIARTALGAPFDESGRAATAGHVDEPAARDLVARLERQTTSGRALGTGDELVEWVQGAASLKPRDAAASAVRAVARCVARSASTSPGADIVLAGGGAKNLALVRAIEEEADAPVIVSDALGLPAGGREAAAIAVLGALCADGIPITLPRVTGCAPPAPVAGRWSLPLGLRRHRRREP